jgi:hypothetical protein
VIEATETNIQHNHIPCTIDQDDESAVKASNGSGDIGTNVGIVFYSFNVYENECLSFQNCRFNTNANYRSLNGSRKQSLEGERSVGQD